LVLNLHIVLYFCGQWFTESLGFLNPPHRQATRRQAVKKRRINNLTLQNLKLKFILLVLSNDSIKIWNHPMTLLLKY
jgi:hypothetical protein